MFSLSAPQAICINSATHENNEARNDATIQDIQVVEKDAHEQHCEGINPQDDLPRVLDLSFSGIDQDETNPPEHAWESGRLQAPEASMRMEDKAFQCR